LRKGYSPLHEAASSACAPSSQLRRGTTRPIRSKLRPSLPLRIRDRVAAGSPARMRFGNVIPFRTALGRLGHRQDGHERSGCFLRFGGPRRNKPALIVSNLVRPNCGRGTGRRAWRESHLAEALGGFEAGAVGEFRGADLLASFEFDGLQAQDAGLAASNKPIAVSAEQSTRHAANGREGGIDFCWQRGVVHCRLAPEVAGLAAKPAIGAGPGSETSHTVVNFLSRAVPINAAIFLLQNGGDGRLRVVLWPRKDGARVEPTQGLFNQRGASLGHSQS